MTNTFWTSEGTHVKDVTVKESNRGMFRTDMQTIATAIIKFTNGDWIGVSRWHDEPYWVADCAFRENGMPVFSNGEGSRVTNARTLSDDEIIFWLNGQVPFN